MSNTQERLELTLRYLHDKYPGKYDDMTTEQISRQPYHKQIWAWWEAMAHFSIGNYYPSLDKAPDRLKSIWVTDDDVINNYEWVNGRYEYLQRWTKEFCKDVYGDRIPGSY